MLFRGEARDFLVLAMAAIARRTHRETLESREKQFAIPRQSLVQRSQRARAGRARSPRHSVAAVLSIVPSGDFTQSDQPQNAPPHLVADTNLAGNGPKTAADADGAYDSFPLRCKFAGPGGGAPS